MSSKSQIEEKVIEIKANGVQANNTIQELARTARTLGKELKNLAPNSKEFIDSTKRLTEVKDRLKQVTTEAYRSGKAWEEFKKQAMSIGAGVVGGNLLTAGFGMLKSFLGNGIDKAAQLSDELANIGKVTSLTNAELKDLNEELKGMATRTSTSTLRELAVQAGKLGIDGKRNILEFVKAADKIQMALGEDLGQDTLISVGKLVNVFKLKDQFGIEQSMLKVASSINSVGQASEASEPHIVDFLNQVGGTGETVGESIADLVGLAGALDSVGLTAEVSATAFKDNIVEFVRDTEKWAKVAGYNVGELSQILAKEGTNEAFLQFIQKLKEGTSGQAEFLSKLQELGINGARGANVFLTIANNIGRVREQQELANKSFDEGTSIADEAARKQLNTASIYEQTGKKINAAIQNNAITKTIAQLYEGFGRLIIDTEKLSDAMQKEITDLGVLELQIYDVNTSSEDRIKLINELKKNYPDYLKNIDAEKVSNQQLSEVLQEINNDLVDRLVIQKSIEANDEKANAIAEKKLTLLTQERGLREYLIKQAQEQGIKLNKTGSLENQANDFLNKYDPNKSSSESQTIEIINTYLDGLKKARLELKKEQAAYKQDVNTTKELAAELGVAYGAPKKAATKNNLTGGGGLGTDEEKASETAAKKYINDTKKLLDELKKLNVEAIANEEQQAVAKLAFDAKLRIDEIKATEADAKVKADLIKQIESNLQTDITQLRKKYVDERNKQEYEDTLKALNDHYSQQRIIAANNFVTGITSEAEFNDAIEKIDQDYLLQKLTAAKDYGIDTLEIERQIAEGKIKWTQEDLKQFEDALRQKQNAQIAAGKLSVINTRANTQERLDAEIELLHLQMEQEIEVAKLTEEEKALIRAEYAEQEKELRSASYKEQLDNVENFTQQSMDIYSKVIDTRVAKEKKATTETYNNDLEKLKDKLKQGELNEEQYRTAVSALDARYRSDLNAAERKAFKQKKQMALAQAHMNTAMGVTRAFFDYGWPYNLVVGAIITAQGLAQYSAINAQQEPDRFRRGTRLVGPSHENGGIQLYGNGGHFGEAEGDELIMTKGVYRNPLGRKLASDLNEAFGGIRFDGYNSMTAPPRFEFGTIIGSSGYTSTLSNTNELQMRLNMQESFMLEMAKTFAEIKSTPFQAYISYDLHKRQMEDLERAKNR